jgi:hypothetical protein
MATTHYQLLGVKADATVEEIRVAYRALIRKNHPDIIGPTGEFKTRLLNEAQHHLSDPLRRSVYDRSIRPHAAPPQHMPPPQQASPSAQGPAQRTSARVNFTPGPEYEEAQEQGRLWTRRSYLAWRNAWLISLGGLLGSVVLPVIFVFNSDSPLRALPAGISIATLVVAWSARRRPFFAVVAVIGVSLWPLGLFGTWPAAALLAVIDPVYLASVTMGGVAAVAFRISAGPAAALWQARPFRDRTAK